MEAIINQLYQVFNYSKPLKINNVCTTCCMSEENARLLLTTPLYEIPVELIQEYNDGAQAVEFDRNELYYFLPRYLELLSQFHYTSAVDVALSLKNLKFDNQAFWTEPDEVNVIQDFVVTFFKQCLHSETFPESCELFDLLNMIAVSGFAIQPLLQIWLNELSGISILHLEKLIANNFNYRGKIHQNSFASADFNSTIENWIQSNKKLILHAIEGHIMRSSLAEEKLNKLSYLYDTLLYL